MQQTDLKRRWRRVGAARRGVGSGGRATAVVLNTVLKQLTNACVGNVATVLDNQHELKNAVKHSEAFRTVGKRHSVREEKVELLSGGELVVNDKVARVVAPGHAR
jgi:hypothetical protein